MGLHQSSGLADLAVRPQVVASSAEEAHVELDQRRARDAAIDYLVRERPLGPFLAALVACALGISWAVCITMSLLMFGTVRPDYLLTGAVAALVAAPPMLGLLLLVIGRLRDLTAQLEQMVITDPLTQVYNRRAFDSFLVRETTRATRYGRPPALLVMDVDHFKEVNDSLGHSGGGPRTGRRGGGDRSAPPAIGSALPPGGRRVRGAAPRDRPRRSGGHGRANPTTPHHHRRTRRHPAHGELRRRSVHARWKPRDVGRSG